MPDNNIKILLTGGGSGGHLSPLLAVVQELNRKIASDNLQAEIHYLGPSDKFSSLFFANENIILHSLISSKLRRYFSLANLIDIPKFLASLIQALIKVFILMPDVVFSKGGPGALPVVIAGWFYRIPVFIHESDAAPGLTNLISAKFSKRIAVSFEKAAKYFDPKKTAWVGTPLRRELFENIPPEESAKEILQFDPKEPLILVFGGSQGSKRINDFVLANLEILIKDTQILHQTGHANFAEVEKLSRAALFDAPVASEIKHRYLAVPFLEKNLSDALAAADLVVARAGSATIFEIAAFGKPAILIPLDGAANDHQKINAFEFANQGGGVVIEESNLLPGIFLTQIRKLIQDPETLKKMGAASKRFFKPGAAEAIAEEILKFVNY